MSAGTSEIISVGASKINPRETSEKFLVGTFGKMLTKSPRRMCEELTIAKILKLKKKSSKYSSRNYHTKEKTFHKYTYILLKFNFSLYYA